MTRVKIGVDLGGTKIEVAALNEDRQILTRKRMATPKGNYTAALEAIAQLIHETENELRTTATVGVGMPGSFSPQTGLVRNANSTWLNNQALDKDLQNLLGREIHFANDANCLALSEAVDGAGEGCNVVFAIILGTGVGGGLAINGKVHKGANGLGGEWGHNPLPWLKAEDYPGPKCYCGKLGCIETFISGNSFSNDYSKRTGRRLIAQDIIRAAEDGEAEARDAFNRYQRRLAKAIAGVANLLDPDVIVLGGGMSNVTRLYDRLPELVQYSIFGGEFKTPIRPAKHGDSSGVRGAAWLW